MREERRKKKWLICDIRIRRSGFSEKVQKQRRDFFVVKWNITWFIVFLVTLNAPEPAERSARGGKLRVDVSAWVSPR